MRPNFYNGYTDYSSYLPKTSSYQNNNNFSRGQTNSNSNINQNNTIRRGIATISQTNRIRNNDFYEKSDISNKNLDSKYKNIYNNSNYNTSQYDISQNKYSNPYLNDNKYYSQSQIYSTRPSNQLYDNMNFSKKQNDTQNYGYTYNFKNENYPKNNNSSLLNDISKTKIGLQNLGNTCYMNTTLQILVHTPNFINRLIQNQNNIDYKSTISKKFFDLINQFIKNSYAFSPMDFKSTFSMKHRQFAGYDQCDTQEFCRVLLEDINSELNKIKNKPPYKELDTKNKNKIECDKEYYDLCKLREDSIVIDSFYGQIINIFTCKYNNCKQQTFSFQKVLDLPLLIPRNSYSSIDLNQLIKEYFESEEIQFETKCEGCGKKTIHKKEIFFSRPPEILILSVQRLNMRTKRKNNISVQFNENLNLDNFIDKNCGFRNSCLYSLYGIANHSGTIDFGHYFAYIKIEGNWFEFNDSIVKSIGRINNISSSAYVFFYKRNDI